MPRREVLAFGDRQWTTDNKGSAARDVQTFGTPPGGDEPTDWEGDRL